MRDEARKFVVPWSNTRYIDNPASEPDDLAVAGNADRIFQETQDG